LLTQIPLGKGTVYSSCHIISKQ